VQAQDGSRLSVLIHVEIQGDPENDFGARMLLYHTRLRDRYKKRHRRGLARIVLSCKDKDSR
jgi:hypothetical protein